MIKAKKLTLERQSEFITATQFFNKDLFGHLKFDKDVSDWQFNSINGNKVHTSNSDGYVKRNKSLILNFVNKLESNLVSVV